MSNLSVFVVLSTLLLAASPAKAQNPEVNVNDYVPSVFAYDILGTYTTRIANPFEPVGGLWLVYRNSPLSWKSDSDDIRAIEDQFVADLTFSMAIFDFLAVGLDIPIYLVNSGDDISTLDLKLAQVSGASFGDIRLSAKGRFLGTGKKGFGMGLAQDLSLPTANAGKFTGDDGLTSRTALIADYTMAGFVGALNLSYLARPNSNQFQPSLTDELQLRIAAQIPIICDSVEALVVSQTRTMADKAFESSDTMSTALLLGARTHLPLNLVLTGAAGWTLAGNIAGTPAWEAMASISYEPQAGYCDSDGDGLSDSKDKCPKLAGPAATAGCPDKDGDGVVDPDDACPEQAGVAKLAGCPDRDRDFVADKDDACPDEPGTVKLAGCPDDDNDGITNKEDKCPKAAGVPEHQGCPDTDKDGIPDNLDACPKEAGTPGAKGCPDRDNDLVSDRVDQCPDVWGTVANKGCPPQSPKSVKVTREKIEILDVVYFQTGSAKIKPQSYQLLRDVARVLKDNAWIKKIQVEGHTDDVGNLQTNMKLSKDRAASVLKFLVSEGIEEARLVSEGFGPTKPIDPAKTKEARAKNRRVEFTILEQGDQ